MTPVELNKMYEVKVSALNSLAQGVARVEGFTVFVEGALPVEVVKVKIIEVKKNYAIGELVEIVQVSDSRVEAPCPIYAECGGCQLQHLKYDEQLKWKRQQVVDALERIGKLNLRDVEIPQTLGMNDPWRYRNKMQFPAQANSKSKSAVTANSNSNYAFRIPNSELSANSALPPSLSDSEFRIPNSALKIGCYAKSSHRVVNVESCLIQRLQNDEMLRAARRMLERFKVPAYDEDKKRGVIRHVMGRVGLNETMLVLVTATDKLTNEKSIVRALRNELPQITSIQQNIQRQHNNVILGRETKVLYGKRTIRDSLGQFKFNISARSFFQVNTKQAEKLYQTALEAAGLTGKEVVVDVFCGTGTITLFLAKHAKKAYGIEIVSSAIADAKLNARENNVRNAEFILGDATVMLPKLHVNPDVIVLDPPRAGCDEKLLQTITKLQPARVVYVSCNPATLARDLAILESNSYKTKRVQSVDMFPMTSHIESVALLIRNSEFGIRN